jgi:hypothetical protein
MTTASRKESLKRQVADLARRRLRAIRQRKSHHDTDLAAFAADCLTIRPKDGGEILLRFNAVQRLVHDRLEAQRRDTGRVRALILKARQPGISTYVEARYYWQVSRNPGLYAFILTHSQEATEALFHMTDRFHRNNPDAPHTGASNAKELSFDGLDSGFAVGTAGSKQVGRGRTIQFLHGSEVAYWANAAQHMAGVLQAVPDAPGTEIILESTANGIGGLFYAMCLAALRNEGPYQLIFVPWFQHGEYETAPPTGWEPPPAFADYGAAHGLTPAQLHWAWGKNGELARALNLPADELCWQFLQEYPATPEEAFRADRAEAFIPAQFVQTARKFEAPPQDHAPLVLGIDIARGGGDKTRIIDRRGRVAGRTINRTIDVRDLMEVAGEIGREIERIDPDMAFIDGTGLGAGVYDRLRERGFRKITLVNFGASRRDGRRYLNKRAEMWGEMAEWLADPGGADIPDEDAFDLDLTAPGYGFDSNSRMKLESKEDIRKRLGFSPDLGDALALTFAETIRRETDARRMPPRANSAYSPHRWRHGR